jgi:hypothetical protein
MPPGLTWLPWLVGSIPFTPKIPEIFRQPVRLETRRAPLLVVVEKCRGYHDAMVFITGHDL